MNLTIAHRTVYAFDTPVFGVVQSLRLQPSDCDTQRVLDWSVTVEGGVLGAGFRDGAGDWVQTLSVRHSVESLTVDVAGTVTTQDTNGVLTGLRETVRPAVYLRRTRATRAGRGVAQFASEATEGADSVLSAAHALSNAVAERVAYKPGETDADTTAAEALELGAGVCQDHAHLMIAGAISQGIPARYVTGYLHTGSGEAIGEASHAWAELFVPGLGWVGFDPANQCCPDTRYVRLGSGFDAVDAAPIRGLALGESAERLDVDVSVGQIQQ